MRASFEVRLAGGESSWGILAACILSGAPSKTRRRGAHLLDSINGTISALQPPGSQRLLGLWQS